MELFEGDIVPDYESIEEAYGEQVANEMVLEGLLDESMSEKENPDNTPTLNSLSTSKLWTTRVNDIVEVPYVIASGQYTSSERTEIQNAVTSLGEKSKVIKFVPRTNQSNYIEVISSDGCWSVLGRSGGKQNLSLNRDGCLSTRTIQHEFMHAIGIWHEQSRPDRDQFVTINWQNIQDGKDDNFEKRTDSSTLGNAYDYNSVMHYSTKAFSKNGQDTITAKNGNTIDRRREADGNDIIDIRLMYQCISGTRSLASYNANRCTSDCKCWMNEVGCNGNDNACQGSLKCINNKCSNSGGTSFLDEFDFYPFMDSGLNDIGRDSSGNEEDYAKTCYEDSNCEGFNSNGWLKHTIQDQSAWNQWTNDSSKGLYVKKESFLDKFDFYPFMDSNGNDIGRDTSGNVEEYAKACYEDSDCEGFNSNGWLKHTIRDQSDWLQWTNDSSKGFYVKQA